MRWRHRRGVLDLARPRVMGILNVTPDSFSDGGRFANVDEAVTEAFEMVQDGAEIIDIGGESTRPGAPPVDVATELDRVIPAVEMLRAEGCEVLISIDTTKAAVAREALRAGADIINDVSGFHFDPDIAAVTAEAGAGCILMHTPARSDAMMDHADYDDVFATVSAHLARAVAKARAAGIPNDAILLDPGFGFGKRAAENYALLRHLDRLTPTGFPWLAGVSRKRMIRDAAGVMPVAIAHGTSAAHLIALDAGYRVLRVHDVAAAVAVRDVWLAAGGSRE